MPGRSVSGLLPVNLEVVVLFVLKLNRHIPNDL